MDWTSLAIVFGVVLAMGWVVVLRYRTTKRYQAFLAQLEKSLAMAKAVKEKIKTNGTPIASDLGVASGSLDSDSRC
jgi:hypothetical protein